jgi:hypothetical protein
MGSSVQWPSIVKPRHPWLRQIHLACVPGPMNPFLEDVVAGLLSQARLQGHKIPATANDQTDLILTTAPFGKPISWRKSLLLTGRRRFNLSHTPTVYTLIHATSGEFQRLLDYFEVVLAKETLEPADYDFPGLAPQAYRVLYKQGRRGGAILALGRLLQAQSKCIRILLVVGDERPAVAFHFDLVGGHPCSEAGDLTAFYEDIVLRIVTTVCTREVTEHEVVGEPIPYSLWQSLDTPKAMRTAARQLGKRNFFTEMVRISDLVHVPSVEDAVASQYSEGCFATWDPALGALIATVTGSARPLNKDDITEDDLAVIVGIRPDGRGALVRQVEEKENSPPSSESVEMRGMDRPLPTVSPGEPYGDAAPVPVARSKLHGHRGIAAYHPDYVEFVPLAPQYYHYIVSCATDAQAKGIEEAFARSEALQNPQDPRQVVFTVLPGHGTAIVEKWVDGTVPFQVIWECMDAGYLQVDRRIPQGPMKYVPSPDGRMVLSTPLEQQDRVRSTG